MVIFIMGQIQGVVGKGEVPKCLWIHHMKELQEPTSDLCWLVPVTVTWAHSFLPSVQTLISGNEAGVE
jgi:hypothetical protein